MNENLKDIRSSLNDFEKRTDWLMKSSKKELSDIDDRDRKIKDMNEKTKEKIKNIKEDAHNMESRINGMNTSIKQMIHRIKGLATDKNYKDLKEKVDNMKYDQLATEEFLRKEVKRQLKQ